MCIYKKKGMRANTELLQVQPANTAYDPKMPLRDKRMNISQNRLPQLLKAKATAKTKTM